MTARTLRKLLREPIWFVLLGAAIVGAMLGTALAHEEVSDPAEAVFGRAWRGDSSETRALLGGLFGFQVTIAALVSSLNAVVMKSAAYQYSPRLIPLYLKNAPIRRSLPMFVLLMAYLLAAVREVGLVADESVRPRMVVSVAVGLLFVSLTFLMVDLIRTFRFIRVERVLGLIRDATYAAAKRLRARVERLPLDAVANPAQPVDASALVAGEAGYLVDVDLQRLGRLAARARVQTRIGRAIGEYVDEGEVIGWVASDDGGPADRRIAHDIVDTLVINPVRELDYDPALGIRIIVDVANRSLSSSANDPYTAKQALNQLRSVLRHVGRLPLGDWNVVDQDGSVRVSVKATHLRELLAIAVGGPLRYGAEHPDVLEGLLEIALEVACVARSSEDRVAAHTLLDRIEALAENGGLEPGRLERFRAESEPVRRSLERIDAPGPPA